MRKLATFTATVLLLHLLALWALQNGLLRRAAGVVVPVLMVTVQETPAKPSAPELAAPAPKAPAQTPVQARPQPQRVEPSSVQPAPLVAATTSAVTSAFVAPQATASTGTGTAPTGPAPPSATGALTSSAPPTLELPSSDAQYLHNPKPEYPRASRQRGEQGRVVVNVLIGTDGTAQKAEIKLSSGFERLDRAALATVRAWRYVPGKRAGVPEAMWYAVPLNFVME